MKRLAVTILLISSFAFAGQSDEMSQSVRSFYDFYLQIKPMGIPERKDLKKYESYLSSPLCALLTQASLAEEKYQKKNKGEAPPLVEGDIFTSLFEGATKFRIISSDEKTSSVVEFTFKGPNDKFAPTRWKDRIFCVRESSGWKIDDIEYGGDWQFMHKGRLKDLLKDTVQHTKQ